MQSVRDPPCRSQQIATNYYPNSTTVGTKSNILDRLALYVRCPSNLLSTLLKLLRISMTRFTEAIQNPLEDNNILMNNLFQV
jgi:hypothetical protein